MNDTQRYLLKLVKEIDEICLANDIDYYIFAGSMLGLERNEGSLPWDDDIDVIMTKTNYDKFKKVMMSMDLKDRAFECIETNKEYPLHFGKYISTNTSHVIRSLAFGNSSAGIWIDVMYAVPYPLDEKLQNRVKKWYPVYCELENELYVEYRNRYEGFFWRYKLCLALMKIFGKSAVLNFMNKRLTNFSEEDCVDYYLWHSLGSDLRLYSKKAFGKPIRKFYDGVEVNVSPYNTLFCRQAYGDSWMYVPEAEHQESHLVILDFDNPYDIYVDDYMCFLNQKKVNDEIKLTKKLDIENDVRRREMHRSKNQIRGIATYMNLKNKIAEEEIDLDALVSGNRYEEIGEIYEEFLANQLSVGFAFWKVYIPLEDDLLYPILMKLICYDGKYFVADKILKIRDFDSKHEDSEKILTVRKLIEYARRMSIAIWDDKDKEALECAVNELKEEFPSLLFYDGVVGDLLVKYNNKEYINNPDEFREICNKYMDCFVAPADISKILGDFEYDLGNYEEAGILYENVKETSRNGIILLDIAKKEERMHCE